jgi:hypothetical protein
LLSFVKGVESVKGVERDAFSDGFSRLIIIFFFLLYNSVCIVVIDTFKMGRDGKTRTLFPLSTCSLFCRRPVTSVSPHNVKPGRVGIYEK